MDQYLPYNVFKGIRNQRNLHPTNGVGYNYVCILRDKFVFSQFISSLGFPVPKSLAICDSGSITWLDDMRRVPLESLSEDKNLNVDVFCKELSGIMGKGVFPLKINSGRFFVADEEVRMDQLRRRLDGRFLIQSYIRQHPEMSALHPASINTIRLVTFNNGGKVEVFSAILRIGTGGRSVDNWTSGGIVVGIDPMSGTLRGEGGFKPGFGGRVSRHPDTDVSFYGYEIPCFHEAVRLAMDAHAYLYGIHSIGWDLAITDEGPVIIEGNDDWGGASPMFIEEDFKKKFLNMYPPLK